MVVFVSWVTFALITASYFHLLEDMAWGWVPILSFILAGAMAIFLYVVTVIRNKLPLLENEVTQEILDIYLAKWDGKTAANQFPATKTSKLKSEPTPRRPSFGRAESERKLPGAAGRQARDHEMGGRAS